MSRSVAAMRDHAADVSEVMTRPELLGLAVLIEEYGELHNKTRVLSVIDSPCGQGSEGTM